MQSLSYINNTNDTITFFGGWGQSYWRPLQPKVGEGVPLCLMYWRPWNVISADRQSVLSDNKQRKNESSHEISITGVEDYYSRSAYNSRSCFRSRIYTSHRRQIPRRNEMDQTDPPPCFDILSLCKCTVRDATVQPTNALRRGDSLT